MVHIGFTLRVQVPNNHILTHNLHYNYYCSKPKYLIIGYFDLLGYKGFRVYGIRVCFNKLGF